MKQNVEES